MKRWSCVVFVVAIAACISAVLLLLEQKFHFKQVILARPYGFALVFATFFAIATLMFISINMNSDFKSSAFLGVLLGFLSFLLQKNIS